MKILAASRLLHAADADEAMARKYIKHYTGVDSDTLQYLHKFGKEDKISFAMQNKIDFKLAAANLTRHFKKPSDKLSTHGNIILIWNLDNDKSIILAEYDLFGNKYVVTLQDKKPLNFLERRRKALETPIEKRTGDHNTPRNPGASWRTSKRR
jgi:hypothetical protein